MELAEMSEPEQAIREELRRLVDEVGVRLFPVTNKPDRPDEDKKPLVKHWKVDASDEMSKIDYWLSKYGYNVNWALPTGQENGYWALDLDRKDGKDGVKFMLSKCAAISTLTQKTRSGGLHKIFKYDSVQGGLKSRSNVFGKAEGKDTGVDIRCNGGYIVFAPSSGYKMLGKFPEGVEVCPDNVFELLREDEGERATDKKPAMSLPSREKLTDMLMAMPVDDPYFESREGWQELMRAVHSGSKGEDWGRELFTQWSLQHPGPWNKDVTAEIARDWSSYSPEGETTVGTLVHHLKRLGVTTSKPVIEPTDAVEITRSKARIMVTAHGNAKPNMHNCMEFLRCSQIDKDENDNEDFVNLFVYNELSRDICWFRTPKWDKKVRPGDPIKDTDISNMRALMGARWGVDFAKDIMRDAIAAYAYSRPTHPIKNYLKELKWDGQERLSSWLIDALDLDDNAYTRAVSRKVLISAVARVMVPGCKVDTIMVLEGDQGCRKSTLVEVMGRKRWYANPDLNIRGLGTGDTSAVTNTFGCWVIEMAEMKAVSNADELQVKDFLSTATDKVTLKYDKFATSTPRQYVIVGTKNPYGEGRYIKDMTGARRYWPIRTSKSEESPIDTEAVDEIMDQLYAEAYCAWSRGEKWYLEGEALSIAKEYQGARIVGNERKSDVVRYFDFGSGRDKDRVHTADVLREIWPHERKFTQFHRDSLVEYLREMGWKPIASLRIGDKKSTGWKKVSH